MTVLLQSASQTAAHMLLLEPAVVLQCAAGALCVSSPLCHAEYQEDKYLRVRFNTINHSYCFKDTVKWKWLFFFFLLWVPRDEEYNDFSPQFVTTVLIRAKGYQASSLPTVAFAN